MTVAGGGAGTSVTIGSITLGSNVSGGLNKNGSGTVTLTGLSTYTGPTNINGGVLSISSNANLGSPAAGGAVNLNGGTLQVTSTFSLENAGANGRNISMSGTGTINVTTGNALTVSGTIGTGTLNLVGTGTLR